MALIPTSTSVVQSFAGALYGLQIGTVTMAAVNRDVDNLGLNATLNAYYSYSFGALTVSQVAETIATNLGITTGKENAVAYIVGKLSAAPAATRGQVVAEMLQAFSSLTADATYGAAATAWNTKVEAAAAYTGTANVAVGTVVSTFALTAGVDQIVGTTGNDTVTSSYDISNSAHTLSGLDSIDGGAGNDTLNITDADGGNIDVSLPTVKNVETVNVQTVNTLSGNAADVSGWTGLTAANFSVKGATQTLTVANTTALTATNTGGGLIAVGGLSQTISTKGGAITASGSVGDITATSNAQATNNVTVNGGTTVAVHGVDVTTGTVTVGTTTAPTGAVTVTSTGNYTDGANVTLGAITVKGGSTVSVTQASGITAAEATAAVDDGSNFTVTQSDVDVTGTSSTTTVTVTQDAAVDEVDDDTTGIGVIGVANGDVSITDVNAASATKAGTITDVTLNNFGQATLNSSALANINLRGTGTSVAVTQGALTTPTTTTQALNLNGLTTTGTVTLDTDITTLNVSSSTTASTINSLVAAGATSVNISGDANLTLTAQTLTAATKIANNSTGNVTLGSALEAAAAYTGGTGVDTITLAASHAAAVTTGDGNDVVTVGVHSPLAVLSMRVLALTHWNWPTPSP